MAKMPTVLSERDEEGPVLARKPLPADNNLDITPMIDVTFLLLIFFLVAAVPEVQAALDLPRARHGVGVSRHKAAIISIAAGARADDVRIYLGASKASAPLAGSPESREAQIRAAVEAARASGKSEVLIKAERLVRHRDVARVMLAADVDGMKIHLAVSDPR